VVLKQDPNNTEKKIQKGDFIIYFENEESMSQVDLIKFNEKKSDDIILKYVDDGETNGEILGYLQLKNDPPTSVKKFSSTQTPSLEFHKYKFDVDFKLLNNWFFSNQRILEEIAEEKNLEFIFDFDGSVASFETVVKGTEEIQNSFLNGVFDEIIRVMKISSSYLALGDNVAQVDSVLESFKENSMFNCNNFTKKLKTTISKKDDFLDELQIITDKFNFNLFFTPLEIKDLFFYSIPRSIKECHYSEMAVLLKHEITLILYAIINGDGLKKNAASLTYMTLNKDIETLRSAYAGNPKFSVDHFVSDLKKMITLISSSNYLEIYFWVSQIKDIDELLYLYVKKTFDDAGSKQVFVGDIYAKNLEKEMQASLLPYTSEEKGLDFPILESVVRNRNVLI
jgi:hypothetical protein